MSDSSSVHGGHTQSVSVSALRTRGERVEVHVNVLGDRGNFLPVRDELIVLLRSIIP